MPFETYISFYVLHKSSEIKSHGISQDLIKKIRGSSGNKNPRFFYPRIFHALRYQDFLSWDFLGPEYPVHISNIDYLSACRLRENDSWGQMHGLLFREQGCLWLLKSSKDICFYPLVQSNFVGFSLFFFLLKGKTIFVS